MVVSIGALARAVKGSILRLHSSAEMLFAFLPRILRCANRRSPDSPHHPSNALAQRLQYKA
jgi:hypothetical protein